MDIHKRTCGQILRSGIDIIALRSGSDRVVNRSIIRINIVVAVLILIITIEVRNGHADIRSIAGTVILQLVQQVIQGSRQHLQAALIRSADLSDHGAGGIQHDDHVRALLGRNTGGAQLDLGNTGGLEVDAITGLVHHDRALIGIIRVIVYILLQNLQRKVGANFNPRVFNRQVLELAGGCGADRSASGIGQHTDLNRNTSGTSIGIGDDQILVEAGGAAGSHISNTGFAADLHRLDRGDLNRDLYDEGIGQIHTRNGYQLRCDRYIAGFNGCHDTVLDSRNGVVGGGPDDLIIASFLDTVQPHGSVDLLNLVKGLLGIVVDLQFHLLIAYDLVEVPGTSSGDVSILIPATYNIATRSTVLVQMFITNGKIGVRNGERRPIRIQRNTVDGIRTVTQRRVHAAIDTQIITIESTIQQVGAIVIPYVAEAFLGNQLQTLGFIVPCIRGQISGQQLAGELAGDHIRNPLLQLANLLHSFAQNDGGRDIASIAVGGNRGDLNGDLHSQRRVQFNTIHSGQSRSDGDIAASTTLRCDLAVGIHCRQRGIRRCPGKTVSACLGAIHLNSGSQRNGLIGHQNVLVGGYGQGNHLIRSKYL